MERVGDFPAENLRKENSFDHSSNAFLARVVQIMDGMETK